MARLQTLRTDGRVEGDGAEGPAVGGGGLVADGSEEGGEFSGLEETGDGFGEVGVGVFVAREPGAETRKHAAEVPAVEIAEEIVGRLGEFEDGDSAAGFEDAMDFAEAGFVVGEIAEAKGGGDEVEGGVGEGEAEGVGFGEKQAGAKARR